MKSVSKLVKKTEYDRKMLGDTEFFYRVNDSAKVRIAESALASVERDMDSHYETAGFLIGKVYSNDMLKFTKYVPQERLTRLPEAIKYEETDVLEQLRTIKNKGSEGSNAIAFIHLHPAGDICTASNAESMAEEIYEGLFVNSADLRANRIEKRLGETAGFISVYTGVFVREEWKRPSEGKMANAGKVAVLALYDMNNAANIPESFSVFDDTYTVPKYIADLERLRRRSKDSGLAANIESYFHGYEYRPSKDQLTAALDRAKKLIEQYENENLQHKGYIRVRAEAPVIIIDVLSTRETRASNSDMQIRQKAVDIAKQSVLDDPIYEWLNGIPDDAKEDIEWGLMKSL